MLLKIYIYLFPNIITSLIHTMISRCRNLLEQPSNIFFEDRPSIYLSVYSILHKFKLLSQSQNVHFLWISFHLDLHGNEIADKLSKDNFGESSTSGASVTFAELFINRKLLDNLSWLVPSSDHWYNGSTRYCYFS